MSGIFYLIIGGALALLSNWLISLHLRLGDQKRRDDVKKILSNHGLKPRLYLASIGCENEELKRALAEYTGYIVLDNNGMVVGKLLPEAERAPHLRLVVSND